TMKVIFVDTFFFPYRIDMTYYHELNLFLQDSGFRCLAHWYQEGIQGNAIFVREDFFGNKRKNLVSNTSKYKKYHVNGLEADFYIDEVPDGIKSALKEGIYW